MPSHTPILSRLTEWQVSSRRGIRLGEADPDAAEARKLFAGKNYLKLFKPRLYAWPIAAVALITASGMALGGVLTPIDQALIYLTGVVIVAAKFGRGPSFLYCLLSVTCFNFFFIPPIYTFNVYDRSYWLTFGVMLITGFVITNQTSIAEKSKIEAESEKLRTTLLSSVSHDLRTPLASITGASSTIITDIDELPRATIRDLARSINQEAERLSHIVTNLLEVTRLESGTVQLNSQPYFIEELIGSALARLEPVLVRHRIIPESSDDLSLVQVDGVLIEQVLVNLLENAARYTPGGSTITISAIEKGAEILVAVADDGPGIAAGNEKKIFDKFYSASRDGTQKGTGLGLAICTGIVKAHKGRIWAENRPGSGACFYFTLPVVNTVTHGERAACNG